MAVTAPSIAEENGDTLPELGANSSGATGAEFSISISKWELQRTVKRLSATQTVTKKISNLLTA